jgi:hypothetical protein
MQSGAKLGVIGFVFIGTMIFLCGCGADNEPSKESSSSWLRVDIGGTVTSPAILGVSKFVTAADWRPVQSVNGKFMLVGYAGGQIRQAAPFNMPSMAYVEGQHENRMSGHVASLTKSHLSLFVEYDGPFDRIEVQSEGGTTISAVSGAEMPSKGLEQTNKSVQGISGGSNRLSELKMAYAHIHFLDPSMGENLPLEFNLSDSPIESLISIDERAAANLEAALGRVPPTLVDAIRTIGIAKFSSAADDVGISFGSTMILRDLIDTDRNQLAETVVHESAHIFQFLVDGDLRTALWAPNAWPDEVRTAAANTIERFALQAGITHLWENLHESGVQHGIAGEYLGRPVEISNDDASLLGFASGYGSVDASEDMAEYVARLVVSENGGPSPICSRVRNAPNPFPPALLVPFAKVKVLGNLGLITLDQSVNCIGDPVIQGAVGIHLGDSVHFTDNLKAGWLDQDGGHFLAARGDALPYRVLLRVGAPDGQALGLHRLDDIGLYNIGAANNAVYVSNDDDVVKSRTSASGLVLVTSANSVKVEGAVLFLTLQNAFGTVTDDFRVSTFLIPQ